MTIKYDPILNKLRESDQGVKGDTGDLAAASDGTLTGYLRVGSASAPNNTTAGDITGVRLSIGNTVFATGNGLIANITGTLTTTAAGSSRAIYINPTLTPVSNSATSFIGIELDPVWNPSDGVTQTEIIPISISPRIRGTGLVTTVYGMVVHAVVVDSSSAATAAVTNAKGIVVKAYGRPSGTTTATITDAIGFDAQSLTDDSGATITNLYGLKVLGNGTNTITNFIGADFSGLTKGSDLNIGVRVALPSGATNNYAIQLLDDTGVVDGGITFGNNTSTSVALYKSASNVLTLKGSLGINGEATRNITVARNTTTNGVSLVIQAGGALSGGTDLTGGDLTLASGISTGSKRSLIRFNLPTNGTTGTTDHAPATLAIMFSPNASQIVLSLGDTGASVTGLPVAAGLALGGQNAEGLTMYRNTTTNTAGNNLTVQAGGATSGATDKNGGDLIIVPGISTGTGGSLIKIKGAGRAVSTGTADNASIDRSIYNVFKALTDGSPINIINCTIASNTIIGGIIKYAIEVFDGTELQLETGEVTFQCYNKGGVFSKNTVTQIGSAKNDATSGTLTVTWAISAANPAVISVNADSSLTPSTGYPRITYSVENLTQQAIAIQ